MAQYSFRKFFSYWFGILRASIKSKKEITHLVLVLILSLVWVTTALGWEHVVPAAVHMAVQKFAGYATIATAVILALWHPYQRHEEQEARFKKLESDHKNELDRLALENQTLLQERQAKPTLKIIFDPAIYNVPPHSEFRISIQNASDVKTIKNAFVQLTSIKPASLFIDNQLPKRLDPCTVSKDGKLDIDPGDKRAFSIVIWSDHILRLKTISQHGVAQITDELPNKFEITLGAYGEDAVSASVRICFKWNSQTKKLSASLTS
jgi:hypothetical protein